MNAETAMFTTDLPSIWCWLRCSAIFARLGESFSALVSGGQPRLYGGFGVAKLMAIYGTNLSFNVKRFDWISSGVVSLRGTSRLG